VVDGTKKPGFIGQALLLIVPVIVLLVIGLNSLRQDKIQAHREAVERAQQLADSLATRGVAMFVRQRDEQSPGTADVFQVDAAGDLLFPPPIAPLTPRPLPISKLTKEQADSWRRAQESEPRINEFARAITAFTNFLALKPPAEFEANSEYSLGLLLNARDDFSEGAQFFRKLILEQPNAMAESGMPLVPLSMLKLLELQNRVPGLEQAASLDSVCSNLIYHPTPLTRALLRQVGQLTGASGSDSAFHRWMELWNEHERMRGLYASTKQHFTTGPRVSNAAFWFGNATGNTEGKAGLAQNYWLAVPSERSATGCWFVCRSESQTKTLAYALMNQPVPLADYFAAELSVAGRMIVSSGGSNQMVGKVQEGRSEELLGFAIRPEGGSGWMDAKVYLTQPTILYRHQRVRRLWFCALIASCAVAALVGLVSSWRAFKRQERLSELKSNFVSSVSHELRTPVASVRLLVEGLESGRVSGAAKQKEYLHLMGQECRRLSGLIDNILDFSRIDDGRKQFEFSATDVQALVSETVKMLEPYAVARKVSLALNATGAPPGPPPILDGLALRQALLNLIDNAIKHSPEGSTVTVGVDWTGVNGGERSCALISVEDYGAGIPLEEHEMIFDRFYRRGSELNRETQGIGIGLTIVKHIVEAHGGRVLVRSAPGQGSKFTMELPLRRKEEAQA
jgi:signal transduction histidine kinase/tetratricopeptide (TPR) repeat protein